MIHDIEIPPFVTSGNCLSCEIPLTESDRKNKRSLCRHCTNEVMLEHQHTIIVNYGMEALSNFVNSVKYQKYNSKRKLLTLSI